MINLSKELIRQIIADGGFQTLKDRVNYLKDMFRLNKGPLWNRNIC